MMSLGLRETAELLQGRMLGRDAHFFGVSTDTRTLVQGNLFIAMEGPRFDGHRFLGQAAERGAAGALVARPATRLPAVQVEDPRRAFGRLAAHWRARFRLPLVAVTGSNGKTTVKEMVAAVLGAGRGPVLATAGNLNNDIGVPLTLSRLDAGHRAAVIEMGANHPGEIAALAAMACPDIGVITNAAPAHLAGFGTLAGVARAKGELLQGLAPGGTAILNADDSQYGLWRRMAGDRRVLSFGFGAADVRGDWVAAGTGGRLEVTTPVGDLALALQLPGRHNAANALAALAVAVALEIPLAAAAAALAGVRPHPGRLAPCRRRDGGLLLDDSYNANPASLAAALDSLAGLPGPTWLVLGDMAELGPDAPALHAEMGRRAAAAGVQRLYALGPLAAEAAASFGSGGTGFGDVAALLQALQRDLDPAVNLLVKGSRAARMERVAQALLAGEEA